MKFGKKGKKKVEVEQKVEVVRKGPATLKRSNICSKSLKRLVVRGDNETTFNIYVRSTESNPYFVHQGLTIHSRDECNALIDALAEVSEAIS